MDSRLAGGRRAPPLFRHLEDDGRTLPWVSLGDYPTPLEPLAGLPTSPVAALVKREDLSGARYGGNKVRTLEFLLAQAHARGAERVWSVGALGSNHALASAVYAPDLGLQAGAFLVPQPPTATARENFQALLEVGTSLLATARVTGVPWAAGRLVGQRVRSGRREFVMPPGGATPTGALGHVDAALELAEQLRGQDLETPGHIVLPYGSGCTSAGLLVGMALARRLGCGFVDRMPHLHAVRISPWPVTSRTWLMLLVRRTVRLLTRLGAPDLSGDLPALGRSLTVTGRYLGAGYGHPTAAARDAARVIEEGSGIALDTTYSGKAAAALLDLMESARAPVILWSTKSAAPLPAGAPERASGALSRWLERSAD